MRALGDGIAHLVSTTNVMLWCAPPRAPLASVSRESQGWSIQAQKLCYSPVAQQIRNCQLTPTKF